MEQIKNYQANTTKLPFARMSVPVHATNSILYLLVDGNDKKVFVVVKCYALRKAKIRSYFVPRLKNKAVRGTQGGREGGREGGRFLPSIFSRSSQVGF